MPGAEEKQKPLEQYINTILLTVITTSMIGAGSLLLMTYRDLGVMQAQIANLTSKTDQFVSKDQLAEMLRSRDVVLAEHNRRLTECERVRK